jgi:hypothetical protein
MLVRDFGLTDFRPAKSVLSGVFTGTERQCTEDEHDYKDENDFPNFGIWD